MFIGLYVYRFIGLYVYRFSTNPDFGEKWSAL